MEKSILNIFPADMRNLMRKTAAHYEQLQEIRMRSGQGILVYVNGDEWFLDRDGGFTKEPEAAVKLKREDLEQQILYSCNSSLYAYEEEIRRGFLTLPGGHRLGLVGEIVSDGQYGVKNIRYFSGINIRIAHQVIGAADHVMGYLYKKDRFLNTLIVSPPCCGKTTLLRDIVRQISDGNTYAEGMTVGIVDERSEIAGCYQGIAQNNVGKRTDILDACPKEIGMMMMIRSMSPSVIAVDELGEGREAETVGRILQCGCSILATAHAFTAEEAADRLRIPFHRYLVLGKEKGKCCVKEILDGNLGQICGTIC